VSCAVLLKSGIPFSTEIIRKMLLHLALFIFNLINLARCERPYFDMPVDDTGATDSDSGETSYTPTGKSKRPNC